jgi:HEPN domain-containing protein
MPRLKVPPSVSFSQQAAEKALKALYIEGKRSPPPKTHNLAVDLTPGYVVT